MSKAKVTFPSAPDTSAIDIEDEGSLIVSNPTAMNFTGPGVTVTENPTGTAEVDIPGLQYWTESEDAAVQQSTIFTPNNSATNVNAVIQPKGNGANTAQTPDGTNAGGNARGQYATDWQKQRNNSNQVANGNWSTISGGRENRSSGQDSAVTGGRANNATNTEALVGGRYSTASGQRSVCFGSESVTSGTEAFAIGRRARVTASNFNFVTNEGNEISGSSYGSFASGGGSKLTNRYTRNHAASLRASGEPSVLQHSGRSQEGCSIVQYNSRLNSTGNPPDLQASASTFYLKRPLVSASAAETSCWLIAKDNQFFTFQIKLLATVTAITGTATGVNVGDVKQWNFEGSGKIVSGTVTILNAATTAVVLYEDSGLATMSAQFIVGSTAQSIGVEMTNATFSGGGELELMIHGFLYYQEAALD